MPSSKPAQKTVSTSIQTLARLAQKIHILLFFKNNLVNIKRKHESQNWVFSEVNILNKIKKKTYLIIIWIWGQWRWAWMPSQYGHRKQAPTYRYICLTFPIQYTVYIQQYKISLCRHRKQTSLREYCIYTLKRTKKKIN